MKSSRFLVVCILIFVLLMSMAACGSKGTDTSTDASVAAADTVAQPGTAENVIPTADPAATGDALVADWQDINSADRYAKITKVGEDYQYVDNDGTYTGTFKDGKLVVKVSDTETADVFVDKVSGHMFLIYQGTPTEFSKK